MEKQDWKVAFSWTKAHSGNHGNELADLLAKEAANSNTVDECYNKIPKSEVMGELNELSVKKWQSEWERSSKGALTKLFFPQIADRLKSRINAPPKFTVMVTGYCNIKTYVYYKYKIVDNPMCSCKKGEQSVCTLFDCKLLQQEGTN